MMLDWHGNHSTELPPAGTAQLPPCHCSCHGLYWLFYSLCIFPPKPGIHPQPFSDDLICAASHQNSLLLSLQKDQTFMDTAPHPQFLNKGPALQGKVLQCQEKSEKIEKAATSALSCLLPGLPPGTHSPSIAPDTTQGSSSTSCPQSCLWLFGDIPNINRGHLNPVFIWFLV